MAKNTNESQRFLLGAINASDYRGRPEDAIHAGSARGCRCETPWLVREEDGQAHCINCGSDYR